MDDSIKIDVTGYDRGYIEEVLDTFLDDARLHGRRVTQLRMSTAMCDALAIQYRAGRGTYKSAEVAVVDAGADASIEIVFGRIN